MLLRQPDVIILGPAEGLIADPTNVNKEDVVWFLSDQELAESAEFAQQYQLQRVTFKGRSGKEQTLIYYQRRLDAGS